MQTVQTANEGQSAVGADTVAASTMQTSQPVREAIARRLSSTLTPNVKPTVCCVLISATTACIPYVQDSKLQSADSSARNPRAHRRQAATRLSEIPFLTTRSHRYHINSTKTHSSVVDQSETTAALFLPSPDFPLLQSPRNAYPSPHDDRLPGKHKFGTC